MFIVTQAINGSGYKQLRFILRQLKQETGMWNKTTIMNDRAGKPTEFTTIWQQKDCLSQYGEI
jgi:hypothetical protein